MADMRLTIEIKYGNDRVLTGYRDAAKFPDKPWHVDICGDPDFVNGNGATVDEAINEALGGGLETYTDAIADIHRLKSLFDSTPNQKGSAMNPKPND